MYSSKDRFYSMDISTTFIIKDTFIIIIELLFNSYILHDPHILLHKNTEKHLCGNHNRKASINKHQRYFKITYFWKLFVIILKIAFD